MTSKEIKESRHRIEQYIIKNHLKDAITQLENIVSGLSDWELHTRFNELQTAYRYMLEYFAKGMPDPNREALYKELQTRCITLSDEIHLALLAAEGSNIYAEHRNRYKNERAISNIATRLKDNDLQIAEVASPELYEEREQILTEAFSRLWSSAGWKQSECQMLHDLLTDPQIESNSRALLVSAVTLSLIKCLESEKALLLCRLATAEDTQVAQRALVGLLIALSVHEERLHLFPQIIAALKSLKDNATIAARIHTIQIQLLRCRETQKIDRKMREEIIPAMLQNPHIGNKIVSTDILKEIEQEEQNPEWKEWIEREEIKEKLEEMSRWQVEGADVYMSTFAQLKRYPFFNEISNWLRPFDANHPKITAILPPTAMGSRNLINAICSSRFFCNSDKYSFCLTIEQIPKEQRDMFMQQMSGEESEAAAEGPETMNDAPKEKIAEQQSNQYIQDLYRFFKLSTYRRLFPDIFSLSLNLLESKTLSFLVEDSEAIIKMFNYLIDKEYYDEAFNAGALHERLYKECDRDADFYQKMGFCLQKERNYHRAIDYYTKADIVKGGSLWTLRRLAQCYRLQGEMESALHYYLLAEEIAPDNLTLLMQTGECYAATEQYNEAFARFFKVEYIDESSNRARRAIAWCSFITGNDEQARKYYQKLIAANQAEGEDLLNAAHVEWITGNREQALALYREAEAKMSSHDEVIEKILADKATLLKRGADDFDITLLCDLV